MSKGEYEVRTGTDRLAKGSVASIALAIAQLDRDRRDQLLAAILGGDEGFSFSDERLKAVASTLDWDVADLVASLRMLESLYRHLNESAASSNDPAILRAQLEAALGRPEALGDYVEDVGPVVDAIFPIVAFNPQIEQVRKRERLREGLIPNAVAFSSFVDLRPNFHRSGSDVKGITEFVQQIQFTIFTDIPLDTQKDFVVLQLDDQGLKALKDAIALLENKLAVLRTYNVNAPIR